MKLDKFEQDIENDILDYKPVSDKQRKRIDSVPDIFLTKTVNE